MARQLLIHIPILIKGGAGMATNKKVSPKPKQKNPPRTKSDNNAKSRIPAHPKG